MRRAPALIAACAALALLSTLLPWALAFDPEAWLVWGRETVRLDLATAGGPSWKPLPVLVATPLALLGDAAPWAWLVIARTAGLLALAGAAALAWRLSGSRAAAAAGAALITLSPWWAFNTALGNSEGMLAAALLWAIVAHLDGRRDAALVLGLAAALLRPEVWPFLGLYGVWRWRAEPAARGLVAAVLLAVPVAWCVPELLSSGEPFRAVDAALGAPSAEAAARAERPWLEVLRDAVELMTVPVALAFAVAMGLGRGSSAHSRRTPPHGGVASWLAVAVIAWVALVSVMTAAGFAGTPRYSAPAAALAAVLAACVVTRVAALAPVLVAVVLALQLGPLDDQRAEIGRRAELRRQLQAIVDQGVPDCAPVRTDRTTTTTVAWHLDLPIAGLSRRPAASDTVLKAGAGGWALRASCRP